MTFSWSFSQLQASETCPRRYNEVDLLKNFRDEDRTNLEWGSSVHKAMAQALLSGEPLPSTMAPWQHFVDETLALPGRLIIETRLALSRDFAPVPWSSPVAWYRGVGDVIRIDGPVAQIDDWKTGARKDDQTQLLLMSQLCFAHYPEVMRIKARFVWLKEDCATSETYNRRDMATEWLGIMQRVDTLEKMRTTKTFPPKPSRLCRAFCPVTFCEFHGKSFR